MNSVKKVFMISMLLSGAYASALERNTEGCSQDRLDTELTKAAFHSLAAVELLLDLGANPDGTAKDDQVSPLEAAAYEIYGERNKVDDAAIFGALLRAGATPKLVRNGHNISLAHYLSQTCQAHKLALFLKYGGDATVLDDGRTALEAFALLAKDCVGNDREAIELLLAGKIKLEEPTAQDAQVELEQAQNGSEVPAVELPTVEPAHEDQELAKS